MVEWVRAIIGIATFEADPWITDEKWRDMNIFRGIDYVVTLRNGSHKLLLMLKLQAGADGAGEEE